MANKNFFDDLLTNEIFERELNYRGKTKTVYFKRLSAGERIALARGQKMTLGSGNGDGELAKSVEVDVGEAMGRTHRFLSYTVVDEKGNRVFSNESEVGKLPELLVSKLQLLAEDALQDPEEELGNDSTETTI